MSPDNMAQSYMTTGCKHGGMGRVRGATSHVVMDGRARTREKILPFLGLARAQGKEPLSGSDPTHDPVLFDRVAGILTRNAFRG